MVKRLPEHNEFDPTYPLIRFIIGGISGTVAAILTYPLDVVRARLTV